MADVHPVFLESFHFPTRHVVLRMRLRPLTIGHLALLWEADSPYVTFSRGATKADLIYAVGLCAQPYQPDAPEPGFYERALFEWATWRWGRAIKPIKDLDPEHEAFWNYLQFHRAYPGVEPPKGETRTLNAPPEWQMAARLMAQFHMSWDQAMRTEVLRAHSLWSAWGDVEGWLKLESNDPIHRRRMSEFRQWAMEEDAKSHASGGNN